MKNNLNLKIKRLSITKFPYTNVIGLARTVVAIGTLLTLIINPISNLYHKKYDGTLINEKLNGIDTFCKYNFFTILGDKYVNLMVYLAIIILLVTVSGYFIKITSLLHWWISISFLYFSSIIDGGDQIATILTFLLIPICLTDPRKNHWTKIKPFAATQNIFAIVTTWIIRLQVAVIYFHAAISKMAVPEWENGTAIYYWFNHSVFGQPQYLSFINNFLSNYIIVSIATYGAIMLEIAIFLGLFAKMRYRQKILICGITFHFIIILIHGIFSFFFSISACLLIYLIPTHNNLNFNIWYPKKSNSYI